MHSFSEDPTTHIEWGLIPRLVPPKSTTNKKTKTIGGLTNLLLLVSDSGIPGEFCRNPQLKQSFSMASTNPMISTQKARLFDRIDAGQVENLRDGVKSSQKTSHKICHIQGPPLGVHTGALNLPNFLCESLSLLTPSWLTAVSKERCSLPDL